MFSACSPVSRLSEGERFLESIEITNPDEAKPTHHAAFLDVLRQNTNTRLFGVRLPLRIHSMVRPEALD
ncbi:MAG: hypothetical protein ACPG08_08045, partial [Flavobacteriales bacterium]